MVEYGSKIEEKVKAMQSEIKGTNSDGKETRTQRFGPEGRNKHSTRTEWKNKNYFLKNDRLRNLQDNFKRSSIRIIGVPEGEAEEQEMENLIEQIMKENFPQSGKWNRLPASPGSSENPKEVGPKEAHTKAHHNYISQD